SRRFVQVLDRYDWEQLTERPMIGNGSKNRKNGQVLCAQEPSEIAELLGNVLGLLGVTVGALTDVPEKYLSLRAIFQGYQPEVEKREQLFSVFERVVIVLAIILD